MLQRFQSSAFLWPTYNEQRCKLTFWGSKTKFGNFWWTFSKTTWRKEGSVIPVQDSALICCERRLQDFYGFLWQLYLQKRGFETQLSFYFFLLLFFSFFRLPFCRFFLSQTDLFQVDFLQDSWEWGSHFFICLEHLFVWIFFFFCRLIFVERVSYGGGGCEGAGCSGDNSFKRLQEIFPVNDSIPFNYCMEILCWNEICLFVHFPHMNIPE